MDESLRNRAREVFEKDQKQLDDVFEPSSDVKAVGIVSSITITENADGTYTKTVKEEKAEDLYFDDSVVGKVENQIKEDAETLQEFCKEFDNQIITLNAQINTKKQEIVTLSTEAIARNCWPGIAYSTTTTSGTIKQTGLGLSVTQNFGNDYSMFEDRDAIEIYKKMAGPYVDYGAENPFDPTSIVTLTSSYSGFGHENNKDNGRLNAGDAATEVEATDYNIGGGGDGSKEYLTNFESSTNLGTVRSDVSTVLANHTTVRNVGAFRAYGGVGVAPEATNTSLTGTDGGNRCIAIRTEINTLISDVQTLRTQRDAAVNRSNLNKVKEKKMEKELQNWGAENVRKKQIQRKTSNADVISAVDAMISQTSDESPAGYDGPAFEQTYTSNTTITIPNGVTSVDYVIHGGNGGQGGNSSGGSGPTFGNQSGGVGAQGQHLVGTLNNVAGLTLILTMGSNGGNGGGNIGAVAGGSGGTGYYNGGNGGYQPGGETWGSAGSGGGGGGSSAISSGAILLVLSGGGGGGGGADPNLSFVPEAGKTSSTVTSTLGTPNVGGTGGDGTASGNASSGGGGGGSIGGNGGSPNGSGNHISGFGGFGGSAYYNLAYHNSTSTVLSSSSNTSFITITYS